MKEVNRKVLCPVKHNSVLYLTSGMIILKLHHSELNILLIEILSEQFFPIQVYKTKLIL